MSEYIKTDLIDADEQLMVTEIDAVAEAEEAIELIKNKSYQQLRSRMEGLVPPELADIINRLPYRASNIFFRLLPKQAAAEVFALLDGDKCRELISVFTDSELSGLLSELYADDAVDIIEEMPAAVVKRILNNSSLENRDEINHLLRYPKDSAGTIMTTEYVRLQPEMTVTEALLHIRHVAIDKETIYTCFVTDAEKRLIGIVTAKKLLISEPEEKISAIMQERVISAMTDDDKEQVAGKLEKYGFLSLPVVDREMRLVGIVTVDDAIDVIKEETEEDISKMAAIIPTDEPYLSESVPRAFLARIPWLLFLMISATLSSTILSFFEGRLIPVLTIFIPMLMATGGNSGSQSSVTIVRALGAGKVAGSDLPRILLKELRVGVLCGVVLGTVAFGKVMLLDKLIMRNSSITLWVAFCVSVTLAITVLAAKLIGCILPILAKRLNLDPAVMASPLITTLVDAIALLLYFFISANAFGLVV